MPATKAFVLRKRRRRLCNTPDANEKIAVEIVADEDTISVATTKGKYR